MRLRDFTASLQRGIRSNKAADLGFGDSLTVEGERLINKDGSYNIRREGGAAWRPYQALVEMSWLQFFAVITGFYLLVNTFFALLYLLVGVETLSGAVPAHEFTSDFSTAFFFSVQTFTTVGYGAISPEGAWANLIASFDALVGLMAFALATGLFFARFAQPKSSILFSDTALVRQYKDSPYLSFQFQIVNQRNNKLINLSAKLTMSWVETEEDGKKIRRFAMLPLEREEVFLFPLNWVIVHIIDRDSPLWGMTQADMEEVQPEFLVLMQGYDETFAQDVHANSSYTFSDMVWNKKFVRMYHTDGDRTVLDLGKIDELEGLRS
jgi:inward rectifier potassium channel